jgi:anaerobic magnesium-protoporphyrin IX monomethyl ester cyclase
MIAGGSYTASFQDRLLDIFDSVVVGGGEGILRVVDALRSGEKSSERTIVNPFTSYVYPVFPKGGVLSLHTKSDLVRSGKRPLVHAQYARKNSLEIMLETGCGGSCSFCEVSALRRIFGKEYRVNLSDPEKAVSLIARVLSESNSSLLEYIYFFDEDFLLKPESWIRSFSESYERRVGLPFFIFSTPISVVAFEEKLRLLGNIGLDTVNIGVQTGSQKIAREIFERKETRREAVSAGEILFRLYSEGVISSPPMLDFIILNPYESSSDVLETIELIRKLPVPFEAAMHCMSFFRGAPLYERAVAEGVIPEDYIFRYDLHDFMSRVRTNEFHLDFRGSNRDWLLYNAILYSMNGTHRHEGDERVSGSVSETSLSQYMKGGMSFEDILAFANHAPNPMDGVVFHWERNYV